MSVYEKNIYSNIRLEDVEKRRKDEEGKKIEEIVSVYWGFDERTRLE